MFFNRQLSNFQVSYLFHLILTNISNHHVKDPVQNFPKIWLFGQIAVFGHGQIAVFGHGQIAVFGHGQIAVFGHGQIPVFSTLLQNSVLF